MRFNPKGDYKAEFEREVNEIIDLNIEDRQERIQAIGALVDDYSLCTGEAPDPVQLERLADYILREELTDSSKNKVQANEYPILSETQIRRRTEGRHQRKKNAQSEVRLGAAAAVGTDGRNYRYPSRRKRTVREYLYMDEKNVTRNKERQKKYREYTKPGPVFVYKLDKGEDV